MSRKEELREILIGKRERHGQQIENIDNIISYEQGLLPGSYFDFI